MTKIGFLVNPVAGMGGKVGLKGSDGRDIQEKARCLGAKPESALKAQRALEELAGVKDDILLLTCPGEMGADLALKLGFRCETVGEIKPGETTAEDTVRLVRALKDAGAGLILFAGGDGTARNVLDAVGTAVPAIGIPAGCKIYSAVYAINPEKAGQAAAKWAKGEVRSCREAEVLDIDEELFRQNVVQARLYGYLQVPNERRMMQNMKSGGAHGEEANVDMLCNYMANTVEKDTLYIMGSGSTVNRIAQKLGWPNTLLGVDLVYNGYVVQKDATEQQILAALQQHGRAKVIVTIIGGQGYLFGRGNQQLSARVLQAVGKENIVVVAARDKIMALFDQKLYIDTGDAGANKALCGYYKVVVGYEDYIMKAATC